MMTLLDSPLGPPSVSQSPLSRHLHWVQDRAPGFRTRIACSESHGGHGLGVVVVEDVVLVVKVVPLDVLESVEVAVAVDVVVVSFGPSSSH